MAKISGYTEDTSPTTAAFLLGNNAGVNTVRFRILTIFNLFMSWLGAWQSWTPTFTGNFSNLGNSIVDAKFQQIGKTVHYRMLITCGSTPVSGGDGSSVTFSLPVPAHAAYQASARWPIGWGEYEDAGVNNYPGYIIMDGGNPAKALFLYLKLNGSQINWQGSLPASFTPGDTIQMHGTYEAA